MFCDYKLYFLLQTYQIFEFRQDIFNVQYPVSTYLRNITPGLLTYWRVAYILMLGSQDKWTFEFIIIYFQPWGRPLDDGNICIHIVWLVYKVKDQHVYYDAVRSTFALNCGCGISLSEQIVQFVQPIGCRYFPAGWWMIARICFAPLFSTGHEGSTPKNTTNIC